MTKARELRLAKRMARLGTETAFEVLVKARALEAKGRDESLRFGVHLPVFAMPSSVPPPQTELVLARTRAAA